MIPHTFKVAGSVDPMIDYNRKLFIYLQPIDDRMELWELIIIGKNLQAKEFHFYLTPNAKFYSTLVIK